ncbi:chaplin [Streptomyces yaizuensis]|uniref:Chaplin n=1 Tax=Streptomyces yaizuensis TaxID=2989713 RepID=A0ABQ5P1A8_9ACTN|nr:chaplin family protein [Streptomyces sp. YSPA8]GLF96218.1 chaplin [Streptomyces sp. YSPA8]
MRQVTRKGLITIVAAGGALALGGGYAHAGSDASGAAVGSPGVGSGNAVQVPVHVPVNACGNSVNLIGLLNPSFGNNCVNESSGPAVPPPVAPPGGPGTPPGGLPPVAVPTGGGATASGVAAGSPGVGSGNVVQVPVEVPVNACGNSVDAGGVLNPTFGNECVNESAAPPVVPPPVKPPTPPVKPPTPPVKPPTPPVKPPTPGNPVKPPTPSEPGGPTPNEPKAQLAETGSGSLGVIIPVGAGMLLAGAVLYRRARTSAAQ